MEIEVVTYLGVTDIDNRVRFAVHDDNRAFNQGELLDVHKAVLHVPRRPQIRRCSTGDKSTRIITMMERRGEHSGDGDHRCLQDECGNVELGQRILFGLHITPRLFQKITKILTIALEGMWKPFFL